MSNKNITKDKILTTAGHLFAKKGFKGTSIRNIAVDAKVNIAAINYHFTSKEKLYSEVLSMSYQALENDVGNIKICKNSEELSLEIYKVINEKSEEVKNAFAMMISDMDNKTLDEAVAEKNLNTGVPPGFKRLSESIIFDNGSDTPPYGIYWATISIFSHLIHTTMVSHSVFFNRTAMIPEVSNRKLIDDMVKIQIKSVLNYLELNKKSFANPNLAEDCKIKKAA